MQRIGIDLGGTKTEIILTNEDPLDVVDRKRVPTQQDKGYEFIIQQIARLTHEYLAPNHSVESIGIGIPGSLSPKTGRVRNANTQCLIGKPLQHDLETLIGLPVIIENDANCFALSEALLGAGQSYEMVAGIIMGTGMGGGIVHHGKLWSGQHGIAGEWGHSSIDIHGPPCWCGQRGCLELYLSGTGIQRMYQEKTGQAQTVQAIYQAYQEDRDPAAIAVLDAAMVLFGRALANLIDTFDPNVIVLGGGLSNLPLLYQEGVRQIAKQVFNDQLTTPIIPNQLGDSSGVYGAVLVAKERVSL